MADELNVPTHRWYAPRNNIALPPNAVSAKYILANGVALIDAWINSRPWGPYSVDGFVPPLALDFVADYYQTDSTATTFDSALTFVRASSATMVDSTGTLVTVASGVPRIGHHVYNGSAWVNEGLLVESEARTNYATSISAGSGVTVSTGITGSPSGAADATRLSKDATSPRYAVINYTLTVAPSTAYTASAYFKWDGHDMTTSLEYNNATHFDRSWRVAFSVTSSGVSISTAANATGKVENVGNGWYRCSATFTSGVSASGVNPNSLVQLTGGGGDSILIYGAQLEQGSTPSSYIPTAGATVTRAAETLVIPSANLPWSSTAVSIAMDGRATGNTLTTARWYNSSTAYITQSIGTTDFSFAQYGGGALDTVTGGTFASGINVPFNIASRHGSTFINGAVDGVALTADLTPVALPGLSATNLQLGYTFMGVISKFRVWSDDLGDAGIAEASA